MVDFLLSISYLFFLHDTILTLFRCPSLLHAAPMLWGKVIALSLPGALDWHKGPSPEIGLGIGM